MPVGLIQSIWGGTAAQSWTSLEALQVDPLLSHWADVFLKSKRLLQDLNHRNPALPPWDQPHDAWFPCDPWNPAYTAAYKKAVEQADPIAVEAAAAVPTAKKHGAKSARLCRCRSDAADRSI